MHPDTVIYIDQPEYLKTYLCVRNKKLLSFFRQVPSSYIHCKSDNYVKDWCISGKYTAEDSNSLTKFEKCVSKIDAKKTDNCLIQDAIEYVEKRSIRGINKSLQKKINNIIICGRRFRT